MKLNLNLTRYVEDMHDRGWVVFENAIDATLVNRMLTDLDLAWDTCSKIMARNGVIADAEFTGEGRRRRKREEKGEGCCERNDRLRQGASETNSHSLMTLAR